MVDSKSANMATNLELAIQIENNYINEYRPMHTVGNANFAEDAVLTEFTTGLPTTWLNGVLRTDGSSAELPDRMERTITKYKGLCKMSWRIGVLTSEPDIVRKLLLSFNPVNVTRCAGMILHDPVSSTKKDDGFEIRIVDSEQTLSEFMIPLNEAFCSSKETAHFVEQYYRTRLNQPRETFLTGYVNDVPVSCSYYVVDSGVSMINGVATSEKYRNRGFGRRIVEETINHAFSSNNFPISLYPSDMAVSLYRSMGFTDVYEREDYIFE